MTLIYGVMISIFLVIAVQTLLLMVAVDALLAGRRGLLLPSAAASGLCFAGTSWLLRYLTRKPRCN